MAPILEKYTSVDDALGQIRTKMEIHLKSGYVRVLDAFGRVSVADIHATSDVPAFRVSHMDGFALDTGDLKGATRSRPAILKVSGAIDPGEMPKRPLRKGEAIQVATGGGVPAGADAVLPTEEVEISGSSIRVGFVPEPGNYIYEAGADVKKGERIVSRGQALRAQDVGMLIALGFERVRVWEKPRVCIIATGSELKPAGEQGEEKVSDSHTPVFQRLCESIGNATVESTIVRDDLEELSRAVKNALARSDFLITLGGTSVGRRDLVTDAVSTLHPEVLIHGIRINRGRVTAVATVNGKPVIMMPGPIQGAMNAFLLLGLPLLHLISGREGAALRLPCTLTSRWEGRRKFSDFTKVLYVRIRVGEPVAEPLHGETESFRVLSRANGYVVVPEQINKIEAGSRVVANLLPGFSFV